MMFVNKFMLGLSVRNHCATWTKRRMEGRPDGRKAIFHCHGISLYLNLLEDDNTSGRKLIIDPLGGLICLLRTWWKLVHLMACCLSAPSHQLNECSLIIKDALWHPTERRRWSSYQMSERFWKWLINGICYSDQITWKRPALTHEIAGSRLDTGFGVLMWSNSVVARVSWNRAAADHSPKSSFDNCLNQYGFEKGPSQQSGHAFYWILMFDQKTSPFSPWRLQRRLEYVLEYQNCICSANNTIWHATKHHLSKSRVR